MGNQNTTHKSVYTNENYVRTIWHLKTSWRNNYCEIILISIDTPCPNGKLKYEKHQTGSYHGGWNTIHLVIYSNKMVLLQKFEIYVVRWYHSYILIPILDTIEAIIL